MKEILEELLTSKMVLSKAPLSKKFELIYRFGGVNVKSNSYKAIGSNKCLVDQQNMRIYQLIRRLALSDRHSFCRLTQ